MATVEQLKELGSVIKQRRGRMSALELGQKIGRSQSYVSALENATVANGQLKPITPPDEVLEAIADVLCFPVSDLHRVLGRFNASHALSPAAVLLRSTRAAQQAAEGGRELTPAQLDALVDDLEKFAEFSVTREAEKQGKS